MSLLNLYFSETDCNCRRKNRVTLAKLPRCLLRFDRDFAFRGEKNAGEIHHYTDLH